MNLPKKIHQIWIGYDEMPKHCVEFSKKMEIIHPDWEYKLWTHDEIFNDLYKDDVFLQSYLKDPDLYKWAFIADRVRLLLLRDFGGIYCDVDAKPIRPFDVLLDKLHPSHTFFSGMKQSQDNYALIDCTVYGSVPNGRVVNLFLSCYESLTWAHGCKVFNDVIIEAMEPDVALFSYRYFYDNVVTDKTVVIHDVEETRLFSWVDENANYGFGPLTKTW